MFKVYSCEISKTRVRYCVNECLRDNAYNKKPIFLRSKKQANYLERKPKKCVLWQVCVYDFSQQFYNDNFFQLVPLKEKEMVRSLIFQAIGYESIFQLNVFIGPQEEIKRSRLTLLYMRHSPTLRFSRVFMDKYFSLFYNAAKAPVMIATAIILPPSLSQTYFLINSPQASKQCH